MEPHQIDELLERYEAAEARVAANLVELDDHPAYTMLTTETLSGVTAQRLERALAAAPLLWRWHGALHEVVTAARAERTSGKLTATRRQRLEDLLTGPSVALASENTPLAERALTEAAVTERRVTIEQLLDTMRETYEPIRDGVAAVDAVWRSLLPRADAARTTLARLEAEAASLDVTEPLVGQLRERLADLEQRLIDDPLSLPDDAGPELDGQVTEAAQRLASLQRGRDGLDTDLATTEPLLAELRSLRARSQAALSETLAKIADPPDTVRIPDAAAIDGPKGLAPRADALRADTASDWQVRRRHLDGWLDTARRLREQLVRATEVNSRALRRRDELRGLLRAYRAKAAATGHAEDLQLADLADSAHTELYTAPTDLERAAELIEVIAASLREHHPRASEEPV